MPDGPNDSEIQSHKSHLESNSNRTLEQNNMSSSDGNGTTVGDKPVSHDNSKPGINEQMSAVHNFGDSVMLSEKPTQEHQHDDGRKDENRKDNEVESGNTKKEDNNNDNSNNNSVDDHGQRPKGMNSASVRNTSSSNGLHTSNSNSGTNAGISFDYGSWEEAAEELNFLNDTTTLGLESSSGVMQAANNNSASGTRSMSGSGNVAGAGGPTNNSVFSPVNTVSTAAPSPSDYAFQLQQYQNLLLEAQQENSHQSGTNGSQATAISPNSGSTGNVGFKNNSRSGSSNGRNAPGPVPGGITGVFRAKKTSKTKPNGSQGGGAGMSNAFSSYNMGNFENFNNAASPAGSQNMKVASTMHPRFQDEHSGSPANGNNGGNQQFSAAFAGGPMSSSAVSSPATPGTLPLSQMSQLTPIGSPLVPQLSGLALQQFQAQLQQAQLQGQQQPARLQQQMAALQMAQMAAAGQQQMLRTQFGNNPNAAAAAAAAIANAYNNNNAATRQAIDIGFRNGLLVGNNSGKTQPLAPNETGRSRKRKSPPQPRTKVRPCDHCRRRKTKCIMIPEIHSCKMCQEKGLKCTFTDTARSLKRGLGRNTDGSDKRMKIEDPSIQPPPNIAVRNVHPIRDYATMRGKSLLKKTLSLQYPRSSFYVGSTSIYDQIFLSHIALDKIDQFSLDKSNSVRKVADDVQFVLRDDFSEALYEKSERDADTVERYVAPHGKALIDLYFRTVHPSFPILHKKIFLEKYARTHREFGAPLLAAVYLLAIQWWDYDQALSQFPKPNVESLHRFAIRAFGDVIHRPKLSAVQAGLLLLQCRTPDSADKNWLLSSQVVAVAEDLGLGLECGHWRLPRWERGLRRRLGWAVFIQDKWSSLVEGRPSHIVEGKNWLVGKVSLEDFPEKGNDDPDSMRAGSSDVENGRKAFVQLVSLSEILSEILDTFYTPAAMIQIQSIDKVLLHAKPLQLKLRNWYHSLPKDLQMSSIKPRQFNNNGTLQLAYFATEITLHRRIISALYKQRDPPPPQQLVMVCRNAAKTRLTASIEFARDLKAEHMQAFWYSSAVHNFALIGIFAALLYVTSSSPQEAAAFKEQLFDYRWILKVNSHSFDVASRALEKIDGVLKNIPALLQEPETTASGSPIHDAKHQPAISSATRVQTSSSNSPMDNSSISNTTPVTKKA